MDDASTGADSLEGAVCCKGSYEVSLVREVFCFGSGDPVSLLLSGTSLQIC